MKSGAPCARTAHPNRRKPCIWIVGRGIIKPVPTWHSGKSDFARAIEANRNQAPAGRMLGEQGKLIGTLAQSSRHDSRASPPPRCSSLSRKSLADNSLPLGNLCVP